PVRYFSILLDDDNILSIIFNVWDNYDNFYYGGELYFQQINCVSGERLGGTFQFTLCGGDSFFPIISTHPLSSTKYVFWVDSRFGGRKVYLKCEAYDTLSVVGSKDYECQLNTIGNEILWKIKAFEPYNYTIYRNGTSVQSEFSVSYYSVAYSIDSFIEGVHNYTIEIQSKLTSNVTDEVLVKVINTTIPLLSHPVDINIVEGEKFPNITWFASELNPYTYRVYWNETLIDISPWNSSTIEIPITNYKIGKNNYTLVVEDTDSNIAFDSVIITVLDIKDPEIDEHNDIIIGENFEPFDISWNITELHPSSYEITMDGLVLISGLWNGSNISFKVHDLTSGMYCFQITVFDTSGNNDSDKVILLVDPAPAISSVNDLIYEIGSQGNYLTWVVNESYPSSYNIYRNDSLIAKKTWDGDEITINIDFLPVGFWNFSLIVYDEFGQYSFEVTIVKVQDTTAPYINHPKDMTFFESKKNIFISWIVLDYNPCCYKIYKNNDYMGEYSWSSPEINISIEIEKVGTWNYTIIVFDTMGNFVVDSVIVEILSKNILDNEIIYTKGLSSQNPTFESLASSSQLPPGNFILLLFALFFISVFLGKPRRNAFSKKNRAIPTKYMKL
ncbi:MAG: hypothetical protein ACTSW1_04785, partial [Candidatus Hodarchaeales archaeon]